MKLYTGRGARAVTVIFDDGSEGRAIFTMYGFAVGPWVWGFLHVRKAA